MTAGTKLTAKKRRKFLKMLSETGNVSRSAEGAGTTRYTVYKRRAADAKFAEAWDDALEIATDWLEEEARRRAFGWEEPLHYQGALTGDAVTKFSDTLLIFLLKGNNPDKFKDRVESANRHSIDPSNVTIVFESNGRESK
jgi:hypothetical protein